MMCSVNEATQFRWTYLQRTVSTKREQFQRHTSTIFGTFLYELVDEIDDDPIFIEIAKLSYNKGGLGIKDPMKNVENRFEGSLASANMLKCDWNGIQLIQRQIIDDIRKQICEQETKNTSKSRNLKMVNGVTFSNMHLRRVLRFGLQLIHIKC
ncbi:hypothetical protein GJ496_000294 [Pomphorhynchus laevis]|nr:hypothetical protein GJ496_000294 [Pomphorhynchus laevis]